MNRQARKLAQLGATEREIAEFFEVSEKTLNTWKHQHPKFLQTLKPGKRAADERVEKSLYRRATGYSFDSEELFSYDHIETKVTQDEQGKDIEQVLVKEKRALRVPIVKHVPPDTTAAIFWLKNRRKDLWRDFKATEISTPPGRPLEVANALPPDPELIGAYYNRLAALAATAGADPGADQRVEPDGSGGEEPTGGEDAGEG